MRVGLGQFNELTDEMLQFIKQIGADDFLMNTANLPGPCRWEYEDLAILELRDGLFDVFDGFYLIHTKSDKPKAGAYKKKA